MENWTVGDTAKLLFNVAFGETPVTVESQDGVNCIVHTLTTTGDDPPYRIEIQTDQFNNLLNIFRIVSPLGIDEDPGPFFYGLGEHTKLIEDLL